MTSLRQLFAHLRHGGAVGKGRPSAERRSGVLALKNRETRLHYAAQAAGLGLYDLDCASGEIHWSQETKAIAGLPLDDAPITCDDIARLVHPEDRERVMAKIAAARDPEGTAKFEDEHRLVRPDGTVRWVKVKGRTFFSGENGERHPLGATGVVIDITERKEAEEALREREELMRLTHAAADIGTYDTDLDTGRTRLSPELCVILGLDPCPEMEQEQSMELVHPADRERVLATFQHSLDPAGDGLVHSEHRVVRPDGEIRWLVWRGRTMFRETPAGRAPVRNIGACFDITERKRLEEALHRIKDELERRVEERTAQLSGANEELEKSNLELQQFTYIAAHDLQTPLRSISGFAQLLQQEFRGRLNDQADLWIGQLVHHVERMHDLIQDLLVYSGVDSPARPFAPTDFRLIFDDAVASLKESIGQTGATVTRGDLPIVQGDRIQLAQVMQNLIDNGIKYRSGEPPRIHVEAQRQDGEWVFAVRDNGIGIARKHHQRIFGIFRRLHSQQAYPGTGIGLAVCRRVVQRHGGRIWVESEPGQGSTFYFTLPAEVQPAPPAGQEASG